MYRKIMAQAAACILSGIMVAGLAGCGAGTKSVSDQDAKVSDSPDITASGQPAESTGGGSQAGEAGSSSDALRFQADQLPYTTETMVVDGQAVTYRAYENISYVANPVDPEQQVMNIYIPEAYFTGENMGSYSADDAPVFFPNGVGGYLPADPMKPSMEGEIRGDASRAGLTGGIPEEVPEGAPEGTLEKAPEGAPEGMPEEAPGEIPGEAEQSPNSVLMALSKGYVVASAGARGRTSQAADGTYTGKAPAGIVDLKAAVRYLHYNDDVMPGDAGKIISSGTSAGGGMSALLGATGDSADYEPYLEELGAADASDVVYAVSAYCPITNLDNADMAYEWLFHGINDYMTMNITNENGQMKRERVPGQMTAEQIGYSDELKDDFVVYLNGLGLKDENGNALTLEEDGSGAFEEYLKGYLIDSAQKALEEGEDLAGTDWITIKDGMVTDVDFERYRQELSRSKAAMAFDSQNLSNAENSLFGSETEDGRHFTVFSWTRDPAKGEMADDTEIRMMNPMNYIDTSGAVTAQYWRIRHGANDSDTSLAVPAILAATLKDKGYDVDFAVPWGQGHGGDYDLEELFAWTEQVVSR